MSEYAPIDPDRQKVDSLVITGSNHHAQEAYEEAMENFGIEEADRIAFPNPLESIANGDLMPAITKLEDLHVFESVHILDHTDGKKYEGSFEYRRQRDLARRAIHNVLPHLRVTEHLIEVDPAEEENPIDDLVMWCSDHRFQKAFKTVTENGLLIFDADRIVYPGPSRAVATPMVQNAITRSKARHGISALTMLDHIDCGVFGGQEAYGWNEYAEADAHFEELGRATQSLLQAPTYISSEGRLVGLKEEIVPINSDRMVRYRRWSQERGGSA